MITGNYSGIDMGVLAQNKVFRPYMGGWYRKEYRGNQQVVSILLNFQTLRPPYMVVSKELRPYIQAE